MADNKRLILTTVVPDQVDATIQADHLELDTSIPADNEIAPVGDSPVLDSNVRDVAVSLSGDGRVLYVPAVVDLPTAEIHGELLDALRLAATRMQIDTNVETLREGHLAMVSNIRMTDNYLTTVDMYGRSQPGVHYLLREGGGGYVTYENGRRILIL